MIDQGLGDWPQEVVDAAQKFQQGDLIAKPPIAYAASLLYPVWDLARQEAAADPIDSPVHLAVDEADLPPFGIIISQTCDVAEDRPVPVQPWIDVSPVVLCDKDDQLLECDYAYALPGIDAPQEKCWVADLRLSVPLEKGLLVGREPIDPFRNSEEARIAFGRLLGERRARAALSEKIHRLIAETLRVHKPRKTGKRVKKRLYKLLLQIQDGSRLDPRAVRLHVVVVENEEATIETPEIQEWFQGWWDAAHEVAEQAHVNLLAPVFHDGASMDVRLYDSLVEMRIPI